MLQRRVRAAVAIRGEESSLIPSCSHWSAVVSSRARPVRPVCTPKLLFCSTSSFQSMHRTPDGLCQLPSRGSGRICGGLVTLAVGLIKTPPEAAEHLRRPLAAARSMRRAVCTDGRWWTLFCSRIHSVGTWRLSCWCRRRTRSGSPVQKMRYRDTEKGAQVTGGITMGSVFYSVPADSAPHGTYITSVWRYAGSYRTGVDKA